MNILLSSYSVNPYHGSEDGIGWHWALELSKKFNAPNDRIYLVTKKVNAEDTAKGIREFGLDNVELVIVDTPDWLNWYREHNSAFHHIYYMMWQITAYNWAKKSGIKFDVVHHITMGDFRIPGKMYKLNAYTIFGPVGGGQSTPASLKGYEKYPPVEKFRELVNKSRAVSPKYRHSLEKFDKVYAINKETGAIISKAMKKPCERLFELALADEFKNLDIPQKNNDVPQIIFVGRLIEKKGLMLLMDAVNALPKELCYKLKIYGGGPLEGTVKDYIKSNGLADKVELCGSVEHTEISKAYMNGDIFVLPSLRETSGNVLIEAMAHKIPVVALDMSIASDLKNESCGEFVNTNQSREKIIRDFADKLELLVNNRELREKYGNNGYSYVNSKLSWEWKVNKVYSDFIKD